jgi:hypothetical protein
MMPPPLVAPLKHYDDSIARCDSASFREKPPPVKSRRAAKALKFETSGEESNEFFRVCPPACDSLFHFNPGFFSEFFSLWQCFPSTPKLSRIISSTRRRFRRPADPAIAAALAQISEARIRQTIEKLVGFGTRSTLSSMETDLPPGTGVTAAADWIAGQFEEISKECGGCLEVKRDTFTNPVADRIPKPTTITNVYAILRGSDPAQAKRMYLVTGHYDSRNSDTLDDHGAAPGANDDASGVAVSLECARVLSKLKFPGFAGLCGRGGRGAGPQRVSAHLAKLAKTKAGSSKAS